MKNTQNAGKRTAKTNAPDILTVRLCKDTVNGECLAISLDGRNQEEYLESRCEVEVLRGKRRIQSCGIAYKRKVRKLMPRANAEQRALEEGVMFALRRRKTADEHIRIESGKFRVFGHYTPEMESAWKVADEPDARATATVFRIYDNGADDWQYTSEVQTRIGNKEIAPVNKAKRAVVADCVKRFRYLARTEGKNGKPV